MLAAGLIVVSAVAAYHNSFTGVFVLDDIRSIVENRTIRQLWPIWPALSPPPNGETVSGRPLLNLSLAINHALGGLDVWGYHAANLVIHVAAALLLFGILRWTFLTPTLCDRFGKAAVPLALAAALLWTVHPLQTESVTYIVQRAESLAGLCYLLTLYCVIRGAGQKGVRNLRQGHPASSLATSPLSRKEREMSWHAPLWYAAAILACLLGMAGKEIMVTAPLMVLLYDRTFLAGSLAEAWRRRRGLYVGLAATWALTAYLICSTGLIVRQPETKVPDAWSYARSQPGVILYYLRLAVWPSPLCLVEEWPVASTFWELLPAALVLGLLVAATVWGLIGRKACGFLGAWFLLILVPTSSILPLGQLAHEHRTYLSLAAVAALVVAGGYARCEKLLPRPAGTGCRAALVRWGAPALAWVVVSLALGCTTVARNRDYQSLLAIWQDTVDKRPHSFTARINLGSVLAALGRTDEAIAHGTEAVRLKPNSPTAHNNLGTALGEAGRTKEAIAQYREALRLKPDSPEVRNNLGVTLINLGRIDEAIAHCTEAVRLDRDYAEAHNNLGLALASAGRTDEAIQQYDYALRLKPDSAETQANLALALVRTGRTNQAIEHCRQALRLKPGDAKTHLDFGYMLLRVGKTDEAMEHYLAALRLKPDYADAHNNLGALLAGRGNTDEATAHYREALRLKPDYADAHNNLGALLFRQGRTDEALAHYREALRLNPDHADAQYNLGLALAAAGRTNEAIAHYRQSLQRTPNALRTVSYLAWLLATSDPARGGDPAQAVQLAERARELAGRGDAQCLDTLAAAYAAAGRFPDAVVMAARAAELAQAAGNARLAKAIRDRLELYRAGRAYREAAPSPQPRRP
jgi:tetratricopeptide (TPR) repeat protein